MTALPNFTVTGNINNVLGTNTGTELVTAPASDLTLTFTPNIDLTDFLIWEGELYRLQPVIVAVGADGTISEGASPLLLLANDPGLNVTGLQWEVTIASKTAAPVSWWFNAPNDGQTIDLATVAHANGSASTFLTESQLVTLINTSGSPVRNALDGLYGSAGTGGGAGGSGDGAGQPVKMPLIGLYGWDELTYPEVYAGVQKMGMRTVRTAADLSGAGGDTYWDLITQSGWDVLYTMGQLAARSTYSSDAAYIAAQTGFLDTLLGRYGPGGTYWRPADAHGGSYKPYNPIRHVSILNEPNFEGVDTALYCRLLKACYTHIKTNWPSVNVVAFNAGGASAAAPGFIESALAADPTIVDYFDIVAFQPYSGQYAPDGPITEFWGSWTILQNCNDVRQKLGVYGAADKPLWITETGYQISSTDGGAFTGTTGNVTITQQAAYNVRFDLICALAGVERVFHMFATDSDSFNGGYFSGGAARPVVAATEICNRMLAGADKVQIVLDGSAGTFQYRFATPRGRVDVAFRASANATVSLSLPGVAPATQIYDSTGALLDTITTSTYSAALTISPIYLAEVTGSSGGSSGPVTVPDPYANYDFHEGSGSTAADIKGNLPNLTASSPSTAWSGTAAQSMFSLSAAISLSPPWTFHLDVDLSVITGTFMDFLINDGHLYLFSYVSDGSISFAGPGITECRSSAGVVASGHQTLTWVCNTTSPNIAIYRNGVPVISGGSLPAAWTTFTIADTVAGGGGWPNPGNNINDIKIWNTALTAAQVALL